MSEIPNTCTSPSQPEEVTHALNFDIEMRPPGAPITDIENLINEIKVNDKKIRKQMENQEELIFQLGKRMEELEDQVKKEERQEKSSELNPTAISNPGANKGGQN